MKNNELSFKIRLAQKDDWQRIIDIYNQSILEIGKTADLEPQTIETRKNWLELHLSPQYPILVAEINSKIIGWCSLSPYRSGRKALERTLEISYYIDKDFRSKGFGSKLLKTTIDLAKQKKIKNLFAILLDINSQSVLILEKFGFSRWGHLPGVAEINGEIYGQFIYGKNL